MKKNDKKKLEVSAEWHKFIAKVFPKGCKLPPLQRVEMKRAFYAGFGQALVLMHEKVGAMEESEAVEAMDSLNEEVQTFWSRQVQYTLKAEDN